MIDVRVTQYDGINRRGVHRKRLVISRFILAATLNHSALKQYDVFASVDLIQRSGHLFGSAEKCDAECHGSGTRIGTHLN